MGPENLYFNIFKTIKSIERKLGFKSEIKWTNFTAITAFHIFGFYWSFHHAFPVKWQTLLLGWIFTVFSGMGITIGAHRLFTHKCFKATKPLKIFLALSFAATGQNSIYSWVRDHRLHHKYSDTDADPHNANRGLLFSHIGWLMMKKNDLVLQKGKQIDMRDMEEDPIVMFEKRHSAKLSLVFCYLLPTITCILCGETWKCAIAWQCFIRVLYVFHTEMTVNSLAHAFGPKPYNKNIFPSQNFIVSTLTLGEGWHNYHHVFPYDYKSAETFDILNFGTFLIRLYEKWGLAYDLKEPSKETIKAVTERLNKKKDAVDIGYKINNL